MDRWFLKLMSLIHTKSPIIVRLSASSLWPKIFSTILASFSTSSFLHALSSYANFRLCPPFAIFTISNIKPYGFGIVTCDSAMTTHLTNFCVFRGEVGASSNGWKRKRVLKLT